MKINIFEGTRRVVKLITVLSVVGLFWFAFLERDPWENIQENALGVVVGLTFLWVLSWAIGWVVRGFLGIPMGQDRKPGTDSTH